MAKNDVTINDSFFEEIGKSEAVVSLCQSAADRIAARARASAPVSTRSDDKTPHSYRDAIHTQKRESRYRTVVEVVASDPISIIVESRTGNLARALKSEGRSR